MHTHGGPDLPRNAIKPVTEPKAHDGFATASDDQQPDIDHDAMMRSIG